MIPRILDCTLRDGGYYNAWDFGKETVDEYVKAANTLPVDYIEVGYRNKPAKEYLGKYGYCPVFELADLRSKSTKKIAVMLNEKDVRPADLAVLLEPVRGFVDMVRLAVDPENFERALALAEAVKRYGFEIGFNMMYLSKWKSYPGFFDNLSRVNGIVDVFSLVDSFGSVSPEEVTETFAAVKGAVKCSLGFHGHNNLELAFVNTMTAIDSGVDYVDATILGMGRGAGNLKTELLLTWLNKRFGLEVDFNVLGNVVSAFAPLLQKYQWGTSLPYMLSGANSFPQKEVMAWIDNRYYSLNSIVRALQNRKDGVPDNAKYPLLPHKKYRHVIIIGGGPTAISHAEGIKELAKKYGSTALIFASARNAAAYADFPIPQYFCLVGKEGRRLNTLFKKQEFRGACVLPPYPRLMGTDVPDFDSEVIFELPHISFTGNYLDYCTTISLETALYLSDGDVWIAGYDGYSGNVLSEKEMALTTQNKEVFHDFSIFSKRKIISLTPTLYKTLTVRSCYQYL